MVQGARYRMAGNSKTVPITGGLRLCVAASSSPPLPNSRESLSSDAVMLP